MHIVVVAGRIGLERIVPKSFDAGEVLQSPPLRIQVRIKANITDEQFKELSSLGPQFSPVFDSIANGVPIAVTTERIA